MKFTNESINIADLLQCLDPNQIISLWEPYWDRKLDDILTETHYEGPAQQLPLKYYPNQLSEWYVENRILYVWITAPTDRLPDPAPITIKEFLYQRFDVEPFKFSIIRASKRKASISQADAQSKAPYCNYFIKKIEITNNNEMTIYVLPSSYRESCFHTG